jgi:type II secretory ATPase GspE/PulE/Tfp pilus assembly ATPase PilB-like protein
MTQKITGGVKIPPTILTITQKIKNVSNLQKRIEEVLEKSVTEISGIILGGAISLEASDIHIEPKEEEAKIRIRIDGILQEVITFDLEIYQTLLSRIKLLSGIKLNITDRPQDGRFSISIDKIAVEIRVSTLPAEYGETIVLRILNPKTLVGLEAIGLREDLLETFRAEIKKPNGMIIVTGPTGSGKTTTLYAFLRRIQKPEIKIITIEDPIEYHLKGISQTQVNPGKGYDFASGLQSIMRQDPDVVLVGEIRDLETAQIALQAALTGHLVFTTLHTNDAAGTVARLTSLGAEVSNIGPAINMAIAQRLVRKACKECKKPAKISAPSFKKLQKALRGLPRGIKVPKLSKSLKVLRPKGCKHCNFTGFRGRTGVFEAFLIDEEMEKFILKGPSIAALRNEAIKKGMVTMQQDGLIKVLNGVTTIEEVERITGPIKK